MGLANCLGFGSCLLSLVGEPCSLCRTAVLLGAGLLLRLEAVCSSKEPAW